MKKIIITILFSFLLIATNFANGYKNFKVAIYCPVNVVAKMSEGEYLEKSFEFIQKHIDVDKVYLETHRHGYLIEEEKLEKVKTFFEKKGIKVSGGITTTGNKKIAGHFPVYCYTDKENKDHLKKVVEFTAKHFNEIIFDDFYFTACKCSSCITEKGDLTWPEFRMELMKNVSEELISSAKRVNPKVNMIIKYPNWYEFYQYTGYNLKEESELFDMIYTGTEARDPVYHQQNIQPYQSYSIMRYLENVKPDKNGGGWLDPLDKRFLERYAEQIRFTLFAKAKEVTLFQYKSLVEELPDGNFTGSIAAIAGNTFRKIDSYFDKLGKPVGIASYRPYNATGEPFLHSYLGMLGIPIELTPYFPDKSNTILLAEGAKKDSKIIDKMKAALLKGKTIIITSGFLKAMQNKGVEDIIVASVNDKKFIANKFTDLNFKDIYISEKGILFPQVEAGTNDSWKEIAAISNGNSFPLLLKSSYGKGTILLLVVPDNFSDLYLLPKETIGSIKNYIMQDFPVKIESKAGIALFVYDNNTFIIHSFLSHKTEITISKKDGREMELYDLLSGKKIKNDNSKYKTTIHPYSYRIYRWK